MKPSGNADARSIEERDRTLQMGTAVGFGEEWWLGGAGQGELGRGVTTGEPLLLLGRSWGCIVAP